MECIFSRFHVILGIHTAIMLIPYKKLIFVRNTRYGFCYVWGELVNIINAE
jgi:hypothetical protein